MKVIVKQAGKPAEITEVDFKYRNEVGKLISDDKITNEYVHIKVNELAMVVDEDGLAKRLPLNFFLETTNPYYPVQAIVGTVVFCRYQYENPFEKEIWDYELRDVDEDDVAAVNKILDGATQMKLRKEYARIYGK